MDGGGVGVCSRLWLWRKGNSAMWVRVEDEATLLDEEEKLVELAAVEGTGVGVEELERMKAAMRDEDSMASFARSARASATWYSLGLDGFQLGFLLEGALLGN